MCEPPQYGVQIPKKLSLKRICSIALLAFCVLSLQADARQATSALRFGPHKTLPPQMVDPSQYDDVIELEAKERKGYLDFAGSKLGPIVEVKVLCRCDTKHNRFAQPIKYEDLWFGKDTSIGCRRNVPLPINPRDQVAIFFTQNTSNLSDAEIDACARALVRLRLETILNRNAIVAVRVPSYAYSELTSTLEGENFYPYKDYRASINFLIPLPLETELGTRETMCYVRQQ
jgi:hypothetical protein